jgi:uncharacterized protein
LIETERLVFQNSKGENLVGILSDPGSDRVFFISHGMGSEKDRARFEYLEKMLNSEGFATFRFDYSGQGESEGEMIDYTITKAVEDLRSAHNLLMKRYKYYSLFGSSFGGLVSSIFESQNQQAKYLICSASPLNYQKHLEVTIPDVLNSMQTIGFYERISRTGRKYKMGLKLYEDSLNYQPEDFLPRINCPVLILFGEKDSDIGFFQATEASQNLSNYQLEIIKDLPHNIDFGKFPIVEKIIRKFVNQK